MSGPNKADVRVGVTFIVDLESTVTHEPSPGSFDDPALRFDHELTGMDLRHYFGVDVSVSAVLLECFLEPGVAPHFRESTRLSFPGVESFDPARVV